MSEQDDDAPMLQVAAAAAAPPTDEYADEKGSDKEYPSIGNAGIIQWLVNIFVELRHDLQMDDDLDASFTRKDTDCKRDAAVFLDGPDVNWHALITNGHYDAEAVWSNILSSLRTRTTLRSFGDYLRVMRACIRNFDIVPIVDGTWRPSVVKVARLRAHGRPSAWSVIDDELTCNRVNYRRAWVAACQEENADFNLARAWANDGDANPVAAPSKSTLLLSLASQQDARVQYDVLLPLLRMMRSDVVNAVVRNAYMPGRQLTLGWNARAFEVLTYRGFHSAHPREVLSAFIDCAGDDGESLHLTSTDVPQIMSMLVRGAEPAYVTSMGTLQRRLMSRLCAIKAHRIALPPVVYSVLWSLGILPPLIYIVIAYVLPTLYDPKVLDFAKPFA